MSEALDADHIHFDPTPLGVLGLGAATPGPPLSTAELLDRVGPALLGRPARRASAIAQKMGIERRHICRDFREIGEGPRDGQGNPELAAAAVRAALADAGAAVGELGYLIGHTATPALPSPPNIALVAEHLGYDGPFAEFRQACCGFANALTLARALLARPNAPPVAVVGSETGSVFFDPRRVLEDAGQLVNLVQMGDGAGAIVLNGEAEGGARLSHSFFGQIGRDHPPALRMQDGGSAAPAPTKPVLEFTHDFATIRKHGLDLIDRGLRAARSIGVSWDAVDWIVPHQAHGRMDEFLDQRFGIPRERVFVNADRLGNTGSAAVWLALAALRGRMRPGDTALVLGAEATKHMFGGFLYTHG